MELVIVRNVFNPNNTLGALYVDGVFHCNTLEDKYRLIGVDGSGKVKGSTAINYGRYRVAINFSNRFKKRMPLVLNVPFFEGIRIHSGNTESDTSGCILVGKCQDGSKIVGSRVIYEILFNTIDKVYSNEVVYLTIVNGLL